MSVCAHSFHLYVIHDVCFDCLFVVCLFVFVLLLFLSLVYLFSSLLSTCTLSGTSISNVDNAEGIKSLRLRTKRSIAPWRCSVLSQVTSPTSSTTTTTQRLLKSSSSRNPATKTRCPRTCLTRNSTTRPSEERSPHHCSFRSEKSQRTWDKHITLMKKACCQAQSFSACHARTGRPVLRTRFTQSEKRMSSRDVENERIRILLERQKEQLLAEVTTEIQKHEFQADSDRGSMQELNGIIESQRREIDQTIAGDEQLRRDQLLLHKQESEQNRIFAKLMRKVSMRWKNWSDFKALHSIQLRREILSKIEVWTSKTLVSCKMIARVGFQGYRMKNKKMCRKTTTCLQRIPPSQKAWQNLHGQFEGIGEDVSRPSVEAWHSTPHRSETSGVAERAARRVNVLQLRLFKGGLPDDRWDCALECYLLLLVKFAGQNGRCPNSIRKTKFC